MTTIAEVLHRAADEFLWDGRRLADYYTDKNIYSCDAIRRAAGGFRKACAVEAGLRNMGMDTSSGIQFDEFTGYYTRQQVRYAWLKFAALIAEEQGV